ncbi:MAG: hypothetical protein CMC21_06715 [Flavobacteriaceae bacterium]|nr:hypothetical protein [Flavobacteriaceae bacterium]
MVNSFSFKNSIVNLSFFITILFFSCSKDNSSNYDSDTSFAIDQIGSDIPYVKITTQDIILNEPKVMANMKIFEKGEEIFSNPIGIEYRGASSFRSSDKKSYGIETWDESGNDVDVEILGFPKEEDWILTGHVFRSPETIFDPTLMRHYIGYELYGKMGNYSSRSKFVELEIGNNSGSNNYQGVYVFMEKLKRDSNRIDIKKLRSDDNSSENITGGYILKIDKTSGSDVALENQPLEYYENNWQDDAAYNQEISFRSNYDVYGNDIQSIAPFGPPYHPFQYLETYFLYEYPKADDISEEQKTYIQNYINDFEIALVNENFNSDTRKYLDYIDLNSFVDFFIINELTGNVDGYRLSTYMHKDRGKKLKMGPIWDLNIAYGNSSRVPVDDWIANYNSYVPNDAWLVPFWWKKLLEDPIFKSALKVRWQVLRSNVLSNSSIINLIDDTSKYLIDNGAIERNYDRWTGIPIDYSGAVNDLKSYLNSRLLWIDSKTNEF